MEGEFFELREDKNRRPCNLTTTASARCLSRSLARHAFFWFDLKGNASLSRVHFRLALHRRSRAERLASRVPSDSAGRQAQKRRGTRALPEKEKKKTAAAVGGAGE